MNESLATLWNYLSSARLRNLDQLLLLRAATIEGVDTTLRTKTATISFRGRPLPGALHQMYEWATLDELTIQEISHSLSWSLDQSLKEDVRYMGSS